ncbi:MAG: ferredoxin [Klenkia sp.]|nr:ferredoxin [Klenkia sp.]
MRYLVDEALCGGHGMCVAAASTVYALDEDGYNRDTGRTVEVPPGLEGPARTGAAACPEQAIRLLG